MVKACYVEAAVGALDHYTSTKRTEQDLLFVEFWFCRQSPLLASFHHCFLVIAKHLPFIVGKKSTQASLLEVVLARVPVCQKHSDFSFHGRMRHRRRRFWQPSNPVHPCVWWLTERRSAVSRRVVWEGFVLMGWRRRFLSTALGRPGSVLSCLSLWVEWNCHPDTTSNNSFGSELADDFLMGLPPMLGCCWAWTNWIWNHTFSLWVDIALENKTFNKER